MFVCGRGPYVRKTTLDNQSSKMILIQIQKLQFKSSCSLLKLLEKSIIIPYTYSYVNHSKFGAIINSN